MPRQSGSLAKALCANAHSTNAATVIFMQIPLKPTALSESTRSTVTLFLFAGTEARLPSCGLLAGRRRYCFDLLFFRLPGFPIALLLAFSHAHSSCFHDDAV
jgi:hypothetical protein